MKADLLVISASSGVGKCERVAFQIAKHLHDRGHRVQTLIKAPVQKRELLSWYSKEQIPIALSQHIKPLKPGGTFTSMLALAMKIQRCAPKAVSLHNPDNTISWTDVAACRLAGVKKVIVSVHHPMDAELISRKWQRSTKIAANYADFVAVTSPALEASLLEIGVSDKKVVVIPLGIEVPDGGPDRARARALLKIPKDAFIVGSMAKLSPEKRFDQLIRACAASKEFKKSGHLVIGGDGVERPRLQPLAEKLLPVQHTFLGRVADPAQFFSALDLFILLSENEGFGLVYTEAGAYGVPSIGCDTGGTRFAILEGETGFLVPVNEPEQMTTKLDFVMQDAMIRHQLGANAKAFAEKNFGMKKMVDAYEKILGLAEPTVRKDRRKVSY